MLEKLSQKTKDNYVLTVHGKESNYEYSIFDIAFSTEEISRIKKDATKGTCT